MTSGTGPWVLPAEETTLASSASRFRGFLVASTQPTAGTVLSATSTVVITVGAHPGAAPGVRWFSNHASVVATGGGAVSCYDSENGGVTGCHPETFCSDCHTSLFGR